MFFKYFPSEPVWLLNHLHCKKMLPTEPWLSSPHRLKNISVTNQPCSVIHLVFSGYRGFKPCSLRYRWTRHWTSAPGPRYPKLLTQTVCLDCCPTQRCWPVQDTEPEPASGGQDGISCESFGLSRSRRCSWGNHWRSAATPRQTQPTPVRCYPTLLQVRRWKVRHMTLTWQKQQRLLKD